MNHFDQIENRIRGIIEKGRDLLLWADHRTELISHFCESLRLFLLEDPDCFSRSPARFRVFMSPDEVRLWKQQSDWKEILTIAFLDTAVELSCKPDLLPEIILVARNSLEKGTILFVLEENPSQQGSTGVVSLSKPSPTKVINEDVGSKNILINLDEIILLNKPVLNLGRRNNNDIVINDLRVSRLHAQIRKTRDGYMIFDVGSSGGTFVNGERISCYLLQTGDVISLAGYTLVFTSDSDPDPDSVREITSDLNTQSNLGNFK